MNTGRYLFENPGEISAAMVGHRWRDLVELVEFVNGPEPKDQAQMELYRKLGWTLLNLEKLRELAGKGPVL